MKIINDNVENLEICRNYYTDIYTNISGCFQNYLRSVARLNLYSNIDFKNEPNTREILQAFDRFFFIFGRFPAINELKIVPMSNVPSFVKSSGHHLSL